MIGKINLGRANKLKINAASKVLKAILSPQFTHRTCCPTPTPLLQSAAGMVIGHNKTANESRTSDASVARPRHPDEFHGMRLK
jgi:hypothetical protein